MIRQIYDFRFSSLSISRDYDRTTATTMATTVAAALRPFKKSHLRLPNELLSELVGCLPMAQFVGGSKPACFGIPQMMYSVALNVYLDRARQKYEKVVREKSAFSK